MSDATTRELLRTTCASSATPIRAAAGPTACRSWCTRATPISATSSPRASLSSTCAILKTPSRCSYVASPPNTHLLVHLQQHDDLLLVVHSKDHFQLEGMADEKSYYKGKIGAHADEPAAKQNWSAGLAVYDVSKPEAVSRQIGFMPVTGSGLHRCWYVGGRWAYASALLDGFSDFILITIDMADPTKPKLAGKYWLPGMNLAAGEKPNWPSEYGRYGLHHPIVHGDIAYCSWRDACLAVVDVSDRTAPKLIVLTRRAPPYGRGTPQTPCRWSIANFSIVDEVRRCWTTKRTAKKPIGVFDNRREVQPDQHRDVPRADRSRLHESRRSFRAAQCAREPAGQFHQRGADLRDLPIKRVCVRAYDISNKFAGPAKLARWCRPRPSRWSTRGPTAPRCCIRRMCSWTKTV